ncbi:MAG: 50S ribosomal protein L18 [Thermodesulfobacteriota bacterium]
MAAMDTKKAMRLKRKNRIRTKVSGTQQRPRLTVFRSAKHIYAQIIDDTAGQTIISASTVEKQIREKEKAATKVGAADEIGKLVAKRALEKGISSVVFDRNGYKYHGRVKALSDGARETGLDF